MDTTISSPLKRCFYNLLVQSGKITSAFKVLDRTQGLSSQEKQLDLCPVKFAPLAPDDINMKILFIIFLLFSIELYAKKSNPNYEGQVGKCHLWKLNIYDQQFGWSTVFYMNLSLKDNGYVDYQQSLSSHSDLTSLKVAAEINPKCGFKKQDLGQPVRCDLAEGERPIISPVGCGSSLFISPVVCNSGNGPSFTVMIACTVQSGQKVNPTKCYSAKVNENGGVDKSLRTEVRGSSR